MKLVINNRELHINQSLILTVLFSTLIFLLFLLPHADPDFGWHYRCGHELIHLQKPCINNSFSYFLSDYKWAYPSFIYDALISITFDTGGFLALSLIGAAISSLIMYIIYKTMKGDPLIRATLIAFSTYFAMSTISLGFRSQFITLLFLFLEIYLLLNKRFKFIPFLFLIWANSHAGFFLGPLVFGLYTAHQFYLWILKEKDIKELLNSAAYLLIGTIATLINPFGYNVYVEIYHHIKIPMSTIIAEWVPPSQGQILLMLTLTSAYLFKHLSSNNYKKYNIFFVLLILLSVYLGITARRNLLVFYYVFALITSYELQIYNFSEKTKNSLTDLSIVLIFAAILSFGAPNIYSSFTYPKSKENFLENQLSFFKDKSGNIYNTYEWGGYLIWKLPNMKVFVDGRMPAWIGEDGKSPYTTWLEITQTQPGWEQILNKYKTDYLLIANGTFLDLLLRENPSKYNYEEIQRDNQGVIYEYKAN